MHDYFFISSPLHLMIAANLSIQNPRSVKTAVIVSKNRGAGERLAVAARQCPELFSCILHLSPSADRWRHLHTTAFKRLKAEFFRPMEARLFTGNDRRMEFQYAMHMATRLNRHIEGIYLDEGAVTYVGHKSMHSLQHRYVDPLFKKIFYGFWYKHALTTGTSAWIKTAYVAFPDAVHPLLKSKNIVALDPAPFKTRSFKALARAMLQEHRDDCDLLCGIKVVMTLPHEGCYISRPRQYREIDKQLRSRFKPSEIAIKAHPRITNHAILADMFPGAVLLNHTIGMEAILPLLNNDCIVAGDISSTLLTTRWLRPDLVVVALTDEAAMPGAAVQLYKKLAIPMLHPEALGDWLAAHSPHTICNAEGAGPSAGKG